MGCVGDEGLESPTLHSWTVSVRRELPGASGQQCVGTICQLHPRQLGVGVPLPEVHTPPVSLLPTPRQCHVEKTSLPGLWNRGLLSGTWPCCPPSRAGLGLCYDALRRDTLGVKPSIYSVMTIFRTGLCSWSKERVSVRVLMDIIDPLLLSLRNSPHRSDPVVQRKCGNRSACFCVPPRKPPVSGYKVPTQAL